MLVQIDFIIIMLKIVTVKLNMEMAILGILIVITKYIMLKIIEVRIYDCLKNQVRY
jgi:hypothetical protein